MRGRADGNLAVYGRGDELDSVRFVILKMMILGLSLIIHILRSSLSTSACISK